MKIQYQLTIFFCFICILCICFSCNKDYVNGTAASQKVDMTTYEYLKSKPGIFDSLVKLIDRAGIKSLIDSSGQTFFALTNYSVDAYLTNKETDLTRVSSDPFTTDSIDIDTFKINITRYLFPNKIMRDSVATGGRYYYNENSTDSASYYVYLSSISGDVDFYYYFNSVSYLFFKKVYPSSSGSSVQFQTTDIITNTGVIQVLPNSYTLFD
ncbi:MAG: hypothetical protein PW786_06655 [Arachidicoccus sp.]|nr:hypothetical protein [Arachidicoccus sp.]